ncbi:hypothetical protein MLD38_008898 [Melastoma candidum]|nr:hypothetical protein MLD38_008898 [Melastoma candidum]
MLHNYPDSSIKNEVSRVIHIALLCTQEVPSFRPSMSKVLQMLTKNEELPPPTNPPFMDEKTMELNNDGFEDPSHPLHPRTSDSIATIYNSSFHPR